MKTTIKKFLLVFIACVAMTGRGLPQSTGVFVDFFPMATIFTVSGGGSYCAGGVGVPTGLSSSEVGIQYYPTYAGALNGPAVAGTGNPISFGNQTLPGNHGVRSYDPAMGCWLDMAGTVNVVVNALPNITLTASDTTTFCFGGSVTLAANVTGGTPPYSYQWYWNNGIIMGATNPSYTVGPLGTGTYKIVVIGGTCANDTDAYVQVNPLPLVFNVSTTNTHFCEGTDGGNIDLSGSEVGMQYQVMDGTIAVSTLIGTGAALNFDDIDNENPLTIVATNLATGCTRLMNGTVTFIEDPLPSTAGTITGPAAICQGQVATYSIAAIPNATSYLWSGPNYTIGNGQGTTSVTLEGTTPVTGQLTVVGVNACGNGQFSNITITVNPKPVATISSNPNPPVICSGHNIGLVANGGNSATWYPGAISGVTYNPTPGLGNTTYTTVVSNTFGCTDTAQITVTVNQTPTVSVSTNPFGGSICQNGSATMTASGANTYVWVPGSYTQPGYTVSPPVGTNTYTVTGTATNGCTASASATITVHQNPTAQISSDPVSATICNGESIDLTASGASDFIWNTGALTANINVNPGVGNTSYIVTVTDTYGCNGSATITVTVNPNPVVTAGSNSPVCAGDPIQLNATSSLSGTFDWSGPGFTANTQNPTILNANTGMSGTYQVTATTSAGCTGNATITVTVNNPPIVSVVASDTVVCQGEEILFLGTTTSGSITWTGPGGFFSNDPSPEIDDPYTGTYVATASYGGCEVYASINVIVNPLPSVVFNTPGTGYFQNTDSQIQLSGSPAGGEFSGMGVFNDYFYPMVAGNGTWVLTYEYTNGNGCSNTADQTVVVGSTGVEEAAEANINIYPNPVNDVLNITTGDIEIAGIQLFDVTGKMTYSGTEKTIDMVNYPTGIYLLKITSADGEEFSAKVLKQ